MNTKFKTLPASYKQISPEPNIEFFKQVAIAIVCPAIANVFVPVIIPLAAIAAFAVIKSAVFCATIPSTVTILPPIVTNVSFIPAISLFIVVILSVFCVNLLSTLTHPLFNGIIISL